MALEWYEWECPHCRRYGQVDPGKAYEDGEHWAQKCPVCGAEIVVLCSYEPAFYAYRKESWKEDGERACATCATCHIVASSTDGLCSDSPRKWFKLSCGHSFMLDCLDAPVACAVCGKRVSK